jgi:hypothetical protein
MPLTRNSGEKVTYDEEIEEIEDEDSRHQKKYRPIAAVQGSIIEQRQKVIRCLTQAAPPVGSAVRALSRGSGSAGRIFVASWRRVG